MKMSLGYCYMLLLLLFAFIAVVSGEVVDVKKKVGSEALFKPDIPAATSLKDSSITWKYTAGGEVIKVIEWDNDFKTEESLNPKFKTRVALNRTTGELTIRDLQLNDIGSYSIEINNKEEKKFSLTVMKGVPQPKLGPEKESDSGDVMYLLCEYDTIVMIRWNCSNGVKPQTADPEKPRQGQSIIFRRSEMQGVCCTCTLFNDVSQEISNRVCEKDLFGSDSGNVGGIVAGILIPIILIISSILLYLYRESVRGCVQSRCKGKPHAGGTAKGEDDLSNKLNAGEAVGQLDNKNGDSKTVYDEVKPLKSSTPPNDEAQTDQL